MKKLFILSIPMILCTNDIYASGCGIHNLDSSVSCTTYGNSNLNGKQGYNESLYGLSRGSGLWAAEFSYGVVYGKANCNYNSGTGYQFKTITPSSSGRYCWCQLIGFTANGNTYTSGPKCTTTESNNWMFYADYSSTSNCASYCGSGCASAFCSAGSVRPDMMASIQIDSTIGMNWYDGNTQIQGASSCILDDTFVPPTPPSRPGYVFTGWKIKEIHAPELCGIDGFSTSVNGTQYGYTRLDGYQGMRESTYGLTTGSGQWAVEFPYGAIWGKATCNSTNGTYAVANAAVNDSYNPSSIDCWCKITGVTSSGNSYTSGPQCTPDGTSLWVFLKQHGYYDSACNLSCASSCAERVKSYSDFRTALFGAVGQ